MKKSKLRKLIKEEIRRLNEAPISIDFDPKQKKYSNITVEKETLVKGQTFTKCTLINCTNEGAATVNCI